jgi:hypothetical protein
MVSPVGDFPLNDDFVYAFSVEAFVERGELSTHPFSQALALVHTVWGGLFALVLGPGHSALRLATLVLAGVALWATALCAEARGLGTSKALLCAGVVFCNPIFLNLSYTFMTDVTFLAPLCLSGLFYLRALRDRRIGDLIWAGLMAVLATGIRQFGLALPLAFAAVVAVEFAIGRRGVSRREILAFILPIAAALALLGLLGAETSNSANWSLWPPGAPEPSFALAALHTARHAGRALLYVGLFLLPLLVPLAVSLWQVRERVRPRSVLALLALGGAVWVAGGSRPLPSLPNVLYDLGAGPLTFRDFLTFGNPSANPVSVGSAWWAVTALAMATLLGLTAVLSAPIKRAFDSRAQPDVEGPRHGFAQDLFLLIWASIVVFAPYYLLSYNLFDRYLLPAVAPLAILAATHTRWTPRTTAVAWATCASLLIFSVAALQNYMAWHTARWQGIDYLREELELPVGVIDGGYEFNGVHTSGEFRRADESGGYYNQGRLGYWVLDDRYAVTMIPRRGFEVIRRVPYFSWLGMREREILVIKRLPTGGARRSTG